MNKALWQGANKGFTGSKLGGKESGVYVKGFSGLNGLGRLEGLPESCWLRTNCKEVRLCG